MQIRTFELQLLPGWFISERQQQNFYRSTDYVREPNTGYKIIISDPYECGNSGWSVKPLRRAAPLPAVPSKRWCSLYTAFQLRPLELIHPYNQFSFCVLDISLKPISL